MITSMARRAVTGIPISPPRKGSRFRISRHICKPGAQTQGPQVLTQNGFKPLSREERAEAARIAAEAGFSFDGYTSMQIVMQRMKPRQFRFLIC